MIYTRKPKPQGIPRHHDDWTRSQILELRDRKARRETNAQIAAEMGRTPKAIKFRWEQVG
jgi:hypothetical protein